MYLLKASRWVKHWDFTVLDIICMELALWFATSIHHGFWESMNTELYRETSLVLILLNICVVFFNESYKNIMKRGSLVELKNAFFHVTYVVGVLLLYMYLTKKSSAYSRAVFILMWFFYFLFTYVGRELRKKLIRAKGEKDTGHSSLFVITSASDLNNVMENMNNYRYNDIRVTGAAVIDADMVGQERYGFPIVADRGTVLQYIKENWVDEVFIDIQEDRLLLTELVDACTEMGITVHLKLAAMFSLEINQSVERLAGYTVLTSSVKMATLRQLFYKRAMDIAGGLVGIILTGIAFIFVAPVIYIKSPGPIFFSQVRIGKNGKKFKIYKFRSMYMDAEERKKELMEQNKIKDGMMFKMDDDPRIIKGIGHFIRKTSIDELPQFWNVLKGDMSLVGTRPPTLDEWEKYEFHHRKRLAIKPGITGMWQVSGRSNIKDFEEVVKLDTKYIMDWSLKLDIKILFKTVEVVLRGEGSV